MTSYEASKRHQKTSKTFFQKDGQEHKEKQEENRYKLNEDNVMLFDNMKEAKWRKRCQEMSINSSS